MSSLLYYDLLDLASIPAYVSEHLLLILPFIPADAYTRLFRPYRHGKTTPTLAEQSIL